MTFLAATWVVLVPLLVLFSASILVFARRQAFMLQLAQTVLWSVSSLILITTLAAVLHLPSWWLVGLAALGLLSISFWRGPDVVSWWRLLAGLILTATLYGAFVIPFLHYHDGLPTGDSQKAILWAQTIIDKHELPHYGEAITKYNRDPVDFYTPGLHALTAFAETLGFPAPLMVVGLLAIALSVATALVASAITQELLPTPRLWPALLTLAFVLTNFRFLRYLREPGYHLQNVLGELLLFGALLVGLRLLRFWNRHDAILGVVVLLALVISHQFSSFLAAFTLAPLIVVWLLRESSHWQHIRTRYRLEVLVLLGLAIVLASVAAIWVLLPKLPHLFTGTPHLTAFLPTWAEYPMLLGWLWLVAGVAGLVWLTFKKQFGFVLAAVMLLLLSQGPRFGIDIPPVRALLYSVVPLSIGGSFLVYQLWQRFPRSRAVLLAVIAIPMFVSVSRAYDLSHEVRTNSTLTAEQTTLIGQLRGKTGGIVIDDYNRRSTEWLALAGQPTFARIAADLEIQMNEAKQSALRYQLYLNQLDFEKIFDLGSLPESNALLAKHAVKWVTGIQRSSLSSLQYNRQLTPAAWAGDVVLYEVTSTDKTSSTFSAAVSQWLLHASTLVNDIGDDEDVFEHLPVSVRATRLSEPLHDDTGTYRISTAPLIPLRFNVGDYVRILWDPDKQGFPATALELLLRFRELPAGVQVRTETGKIVNLSDVTSMTRLEAIDMPIDANGFITVTLVNPQEQPVALDVVALGLDRIP